MNNNKLKAGMYVYFHSKVFKEPYAPYYDAYKDHKFRIVKTHPHQHYQLECVSDSSIIVQGHVHGNELKRVN